MRKCFLIYLFFFREIDLERKEDFVLYFGFQSLHHFCKRALQIKVRKLASGKRSIVIPVLSEEKAIEQRVLVVLM